MNASAILELINTGGVVATLVLVGLAFYSGKVYSNKVIPIEEHRRVQAQRDRLFELLIRSVKTAETSTKSSEILLAKENDS